MAERNGEHPFGDRGQLVLLGLFLLIWIGDSFWLGLTNFWAGEVALSIRLGVLGVSIAAALYLMNSGHAVAGHHGSVEGVVRTGAFRRVRHPLYLGSLLLYFGAAFSTLSLAALGLLLLIFVFYNMLAAYEERFLEARFGSRYVEYRKRTRRWIPGPGK